MAAFEGQAARRNEADSALLQDEAAALPIAALPIVVDLDHTLVRTDTLHEQMIASFFANPLRFLLSLLQIIHGRAAMKAAFAAHVDLSGKTFPLSEDLVAWLRVEAEKGREIHLCSAAHQSVVDAIAHRVELFKTAVGSTDDNLKGAAKARYLTQAFPQGFVYAGDSRADLSVWKEASGIVLVGVSRPVGKAARSLGKPVEAEFTAAPLAPKEILKALRAHHWAKNLLIFVPLFLGHVWSLDKIAQAVAGLCCLIMVTSATYLLNDLSDLEADRQHWSKRNRPLASGRLPVLTGFMIAGALLLAGFTGAFFLATRFMLALGAYLVLTLAYSFRLKRVPVLDTLTIAMLFTTRLIMGVEVLQIGYSEWLLTFSMFFFFSLADAKRHTEIVRASGQSSHSLESRGYRLEDAAFTLNLGVSSAVASLLIMVLFIAEEVRIHHLYHHPRALWGIPVILAMWVGRIWLLAQRGEMKDDPVSFALRDRISLLLGILVAIFFIIAL